jgi:hypothetical protein
VKTQDRSSAIARKAVAAGPVIGDRLPTPPRERKPALAALAVLLILAGALGATMLVMQAGDRVEAVMITERVPAGQTIPESAMTSVLVADDSEVKYVLWSQRGQLAETYRPTVDLVAGTVLVGGMLTDEETLAQNEVYIGLSLSPGQYPEGLTAGDVVSAYLVSETDPEDTEGAQGGSVVADRVKVQEVTGDNRDLRVTLRIDASDAPALAVANASGELSLVVLPAHTD